MGTANQSSGAAAWGFWCMSPNQFFQVIFLRIFECVKSSVSEYS